MSIDTSSQSRGYDGLSDMTPPEENHLQAGLPRLEKPSGPVREFIEIWDYAGSGVFRGFTAEMPDARGKSMVVFFDAAVIGKELKQGYESDSYPNIQRPLISLS